MMNRFLFLALIATSAASLRSEQLDHWEYDSTAKTITDNVWTFSATLSGSNLTVADPTSTGYPSSDDPQELNFAKTIYKSTDHTVTYELKNLTCQTGSVGKGNGAPTTAKAWAGSIRKLVFPPTGSCKFTSLAAGAFAWTTNLTEIVNFLPDEITSLSTCSFRYCAAAQDLYLRGVINQTGAHTFGESKITSVTFGPNLRALGGGNQYQKKGSFTSVNLTNVVFDANMHDAKMTGYDIFQYCPLGKIPDLSGFSDLGARGVFRDCGLSVSNFIVHAGVTNYHGSFTVGLNVKALTFKGLPPDGIVGNQINGGTVVTTYVPEEYKTQWAKWTDGNVEVDQASTTWCQAAAGANFAKFPLIYQAKAGELGDWIYDATTHTVTDGTWVFAATNSGTQVTVYKWITYPSEPTELDFTGTLTDTAGFPYVFIALNTKFGKDDSRHWVDGKGSCYPTEASGSVSKLKYPDTVISFGNHAFGCCTNLTSVTPMFGDWVTTIGAAAFAKTAITGDLQLAGLSGVSSGTFKYCTNLTSVVFGSSLTGIYSYSDSDVNGGTFQGCTALTNVTFDANMKNGVLGNDQAWFGNHFYGCTNLTGTLNLSGFTQLGFTFGAGGESSLARAFHKTRYDNVIVGTNITWMSRNVFLGMDCLTNVTFLGKPPSSSSMSRAGFAIYGAMTNRITTTINRKFRNQWTNYVDIAARCWKSDYLATGISPSQRPVLIPDLHGLMIIIK